VSQFGCVVREGNNGYIQDLGPGRGFVYRDSLWNRRYPPSPPLIKAKFHYASCRFEAGSKLVADQRPTSFEPDSVMEFGFKPPTRNQSLSYRLESLTFWRRQYGLSTANDRMYLEFTFTRTSVVIKGKLGWQNFTIITLHESRT